MQIYFSIQVPIINNNKLIKISNNNIKNDNNFDYFLSNHITTSFSAVTKFAHRPHITWSKSNFITRYNNVIQCKSIIVKIKL